MFFSATFLIKSFVCVCVCTCVCIIDNPGCHLRAASLPWRRRSEASVWRYVTQSDLRDTPKTIDTPKTRYTKNCLHPLAAYVSTHQHPLAACGSIHQHPLPAYVSELRNTPKATPKAKVLCILYVYGHIYSCVYTMYVLAWMPFWMHV